MSTAATSSSGPQTTPPHDSRRTHALVFAIMALILVGAPLVGVYPVFMMKVMCFALFACAFNLLLGFGGLLSFGHAMFLGGAGYAAAHAAKVWGFTPELAIAFATLCTTALGWVTGLLAIRRQGIYFAMITLALSQLIFFLALQLPFTGGEEGIQGVPRGRLFGVLDLSDNLAMYFFVLAVCAAGFWLIHRTIHSPFGHALTAIRENEPRAISLGYDVSRYKLLAFILSATVAGVAGALYVPQVGIINPGEMSPAASIEIAIWTAVGGRATLIGPIIGAFFVNGAKSFFTVAFPEYWLYFLGAMFIGVTLFLPQGIVGLIRKLAAKTTKGGAK